MRKWIILLGIFLILGFVGLIYYFYTKRQAKKKLDATAVKSGSVYTNLEQSKKDSDIDFIPPNQYAEENINAHGGYPEYAKVNGVNTYTYPDGYILQTNTLGGQLGVS